MMGSRIENIISIILPIIAGGFIYTAGSDLIPELKKECTLSHPFFQLLSLLLGIGLMLVLAILE
ncbi:MAG: ZIP family metal transporter [Nanoarchaeota archaeon]|nr:ZIP family metal transporter [Nanoarchaeota archaeon]